MMSLNTKTDIYTDLNSLKNLKSSARKDANSALPEAARQFEAVMISMMIKNLRKSGMEDPIFKSQAMDSYRDMYDQQLGMELSKGQGIGFAKAIVEQMQYQAGQQQDKTPTLNSNQSLKLMPKRQYFPDHYSLTADSNEVANPVVNKEQIVQVSKNQVLKKIDATFKSPEQFIETLWPLAEKTASQLGVSPEIILSQAALETGWGKHIISDGQKSSYNLFNIKANQSWSGERIEKVSTEFLSNKNFSATSVQQNSNFRVYDSFEQSFNDYANFIQSSPRYKTALQNSGEMEQSLHDERYIKTIHKAGYATDPNYSNKVLRVLKSEPVQNQMLSQIKLASQ